MPKQSNKAELLGDIRRERRLLESLLGTLEPDEMVQPGAVGEWSVKDVLAHLVAWEQIFLDWYQAGVQKQAPKVSPVGMKRSAIDALNLVIYEGNRADPLEKVQAEFQDSYRQIMETLEAAPEEAMFLPGAYAWTGKLALADYIAGNTCNHYYWARSKIRKWASARQEIGPGLI